MITVQLIVIFAVMAAALGALFIFALVSKNKDPIMRGGCHGDCSHCASHCEDEDTNRHK